jgi:hypothetical protein
MTLAGLVVMTLAAGFGQRAMGKSRLNLFYTPRDKTSSSSFKSL